MPTPLPIACSLTPGEYAVRAREWRELASAALMEKSSIEGGLRLRFRREDQVHAALEGLVAAERECCPFLDLGIRTSDTAIELDVTGPAEAAPVIASFAQS
jgi:MerR family transcriptional regulator, copper efflux regulator